MRVISGYSAQQTRKEEEKVKFYDDVSEEIGQTGSDEFVMLLGDSNGHVRVDADGYESVHAGYRHGMPNEERCKVLELADAHSMVAWNTYLRRYRHD